MNKDTAKGIHLQLILEKLGIYSRVSKSMKCIFPENHKHNDRKQSASYDENRNLFHCGICGKGKDTIWVVGNKLGIDCEGKGFIDIMKWFDSNFPHLKDDDEKMVGNNTQGGSGKPFVGQSDKVFSSQKVVNPKLLNEIVNMGISFTKPIRGIDNKILERFMIKKYPKTIQEKIIKTLLDKGYDGETLKESGVASNYLQWVWGIQKDFPKGLRVIIPHIENGEIKTLEGTEPPEKGTGDKWSHRFLSGSSKILFNSDTLKDMKVGDELWVVEGVWDTLSLYQMGLKVVGITGAVELKKYLPQIKQFRLKTIIDNDDSGKSFGDDLLLGGMNVQVFKWKDNKKEGYDINKLFQSKVIKTIRDILDEVEEYGSKALGFTDRLLSHKRECENTTKGEIKGFRLNNYPSIESSIRGVQKKGVWLIAGRTNIGKTGVSVCMGLDMVESNPEMKLIYICLDDTEGDVINRMVANLSGVHLWEVDNNTENKDLETKKGFAYRTLEKYAKENRLDIVDIDTVGEGVDSIIDYITEHKTDNTCVIIDGMNNIESNEKDSLRHDDKVGKKLKRMTVKQKIALIATCEIRKSAEIKTSNPDTLNKKMITTEDVKGSVGIAYHANVISGCNAEDDDFSNPEIDVVDWNLSFIKNKWGKGKGSLTMRFNKYLVQMVESGWKKKKVKKVLDEKKESKEFDWMNENIDEEKIDELRKKEGI